MSEYKQRMERLSKFLRRSYYLQRVGRGASNVLQYISRFQSDARFANSMYKKYTGATLNLENPRTYNDKLWWLKFHYRNPLQTICCDKYRVREYVESCGLSHILVKLYGVYKNAKEIDFSQFQHEVFLKINSGSGGNIIYDPQKPFNIKRFVSDFNSRLHHNYYYNSREWPYKDVPARIVCEEVLRDSSGALPMDYKFMCFGGKCEYLLYSGGICDETGRHSVSNGRYTNVYDINYQYVPLNVDQPTRPDIKVEKPETFDKMKQYAEILSRPFPHCRVDFYSVEGKIYFGEITFYHGGGCRCFKPVEWNEKLGDLIDLSSIEKEYLI